MGAMSSIDKDRKDIVFPTPCLAEILAVHTTCEHERIVSMWMEHFLHSMDLNIPSLDPEYSIRLQITIGGPPYASREDYELKTRKYTPMYTPLGVLRIDKGKECIGLLMTYGPGNFSAQLQVMQGKMEAIVSKEHRRIVEDLMFQMRTIYKVGWNIKDTIKFLATALTRFRVHGDKAVTFATEFLNQPDRVFIVDLSIGSKRAEEMTRDEFVSLLYQCRLERMN